MNTILAVGPVAAEDAGTEPEKLPEGTAEQPEQTAKEAPAQAAPAIDYDGIRKNYELLAYLSVRAAQLGMKVCEVPVTRAYPREGKTPTKISFFKGNSELMKILLKNLFGAYRPKGKA